MRRPPNATGLVAGATSLGLHSVERLAHHERPEPLGLTVGAHRLVGAAAPGRVSTGTTGGNMPPYQVVNYAIKL